MHYPTMIALMVGATLSGNVLAEHHTDHQHRQHEAHVHGQVELNIAQDGHDLLIEITAPGADVLGFEHEPQNEAQQHTLQQALATLHHADQLFIINQQARCEKREVFIQYSLGGKQYQDRHAYQAGEKHQHHHSGDDHHTAHDHAEHEHHDHDGHAHDDHQHDNHQHGSFSAQYQFHCETVENLKQIDTQWFQYFPSSEQIQANVLTEKQQSALQLNPKQTLIKL
ncbi:MAG: zinc uptake protein ZrgA [Vibrio sp.]